MATLLQDYLKRAGIKLDKKQKKKEDKKQYTSEELARIMTASRLPVEQQKKYYTNIEPELGQRVIERTKTAAELNPAAFGFLEGFAPLSAEKTLEKAVGEIDTTKAKDTLAYKLGYGTGLVGQFATGGGIAEEAVAKGLYKGASKLGEFTARRVADVAVSTPLNIADSLKTSETPKEFAKNFALNTALDVVAGGAIQGIQAVPDVVKALKATKETAPIGKALEKGGAVKDAKEAIKEIEKTSAEKTFDESVFAPIGKPVTTPVVGFKPEKLTKAKEKKLISELPPIQRSALKQYDQAPEYMKPALMKEMQSGSVDLITRRQADARIRAQEIVSQNPERARNMLDDKNLRGDDLNAIASELMIRYDAKGDYDSAREIVRITTNRSSVAAQDLVAAKLLYNITPQGRVNVVLKDINAIEQESAKVLKGRKVEIDPQLKNNLKNANNEEEISVAKEALMDSIWAQIPGTILEKFNLLRKTSMLANPKTFLRNILGNLVFLPLRSTKNILATGIEKAYKNYADANKLPFIRTKSVLTPQDKPLKDFGKELFQSQKNQIMSGSTRYNEGTRRTQGAPVFQDWGLPGKAMDWAAKKTMAAMEGGDRIFLEPAYANAFAMFMKANGFTPSTITPEQIEIGKSIALDEALNATFRDVSSFSRMVAKWKSPKPDDAFIKKAASVALEGIFPFVKTPVNILRRAVDYSPVGFVKGVGRLVSAAKSQDPLAISKAIDNLASGLTGTGIMALGVVLYDMGIVNGRIPFDSEGNYAKAQGEQGYSMNVGDYNMTIDWITPAALPLLTGVEIAKRAEEENLDPTSVLSALGDIVTPVTELSMMTSVTELIRGAQNAEAEGGNLVSLGAIPFASYLGQFVPTFSGQLARAIDPTRRTTTSTLDDAFARRLEKTLLKSEAKIPGLTKTLEPFVDVWGREQTPTDDNYGWYKRYVENFVSPFYLSKENQTPVDAEVNSVFEATNDTGVIPKTKIDYTVTFNSEPIRMSKEDMTTFNKSKGQYSFAKLEEMFATEEYQSASAEEKAKMISKVYTDAGEVAKIDVLLSQGKDPWQVYTDGMSGSKIEYAKVKASGIKPEEYYELFKDVNIDDKSSVSQYEAYSKLESTNFTDKQKAVLWNKFNKQWKSNPYLGDPAPTQTSTSTKSSTKSSTAKKKGLATAQVEALKTLNIPTDKLSKTEIKALIKLLYS